MKKYKFINYLKENLKKRVHRLHPYHLVSPSAWPILAAWSAFILVLGAALTMHFYNYGKIIFIVGFFSLLAIAFLWWRDVIREATFLGCHTKRVQRGLRIGFALFIISEVMFFFGFFWAFFHSSLSPSIEIGCVWPPSGVVPPNPVKTPLYNTILLVYSSFEITFAHKLIMANKWEEVPESYKMALLAGWFFIINQIREYTVLEFSLNDGIYASTFFLLTGFHGLHVIIGLIYLVIGYFRFTERHFVPGYYNVGLETAIWYWHFVDVVWIVLYFTVYVWGGWR